MRFGGMRQHHYVDGDGEHLQFQCEQFLGEVNTNIPMPTLSTNPKTSCGPGERLFGRLLSPSALGGALFQASKNWQRATVNRVTMSYTSSADSSDKGSISLQYRADPNIPALDVGVDEVSHSTTLGDMITTSVYTDTIVHLTVDPDKEVAALLLQDNEDPTFNFAGQLSVAVLDDIAVNTQLGDLILKYDVTFHGSMLSYQVSDTADATMSVDYRYEATHVVGGLSPLTIPFGPDMGIPIALNSHVGSMSPAPVGTNYRAQARCIGYEDMAVAGDPKWYFRVNSEDQPRLFEFGQMFYMTFGYEVLGGDAWSAGGLVGTMYLTPTYDGTYDSAGDLQVMNITQPANCEGRVLFEIHFMPLPAAD
jgi:hypothetical protein